MLVLLSVSYRKREVIELVWVLYYGIGVGWLSDGIGERRGYVVNVGRPRSNE
jgi:hypothetical protein